MKAIVVALRRWLRRFNERYMFGELDERQLRDVGLDREFVVDESSKTFWRT